jgi:hypothetical protein
VRSEEGRVRSEEGRVRSEEGRVRSEEGRVRSEEGRVRSEEARQVMESGKLGPKRPLLACSAIRQPPGGKIIRGRSSREGGDPGRVRGG